MAITPTGVTVIGGVDTHKRTHYAAVIDDQGRLLDHHEFPATDIGYTELLAWMPASESSPRPAWRAPGRSARR